MTNTERNELKEALTRLNETVARMMQADDTVVPGGTFRELGYVAGTIDSVIKGYYTK